MYWISLVTQMVKNLPAMRKIQDQSLGRDDPLEKELATHSSILAWRSPWQEPGRLVCGVAESQTRLSRISVFSSRQLIKKQRHYFADKGPYSQSYGFSSSHVWMWDLDHKEGLNCSVGENSLESLGDQRRSDQSILKEINLEYSLEGLMLKLKLQYFDHLMQRADSLQKTLMLEKIEGRRRRGWQRMRLLDGITDSMDLSLSKLWEMVKGRGSLACCCLWGSKELDTTEWPSPITNLPCSFDSDADSVFLYFLASVIYEIIMGSMNNWFYDLNIFLMQSY